MILLIVLNVSVQQLNSLIHLASVAFECNQTLHSLEIGTVNGDQLVIDFLSLVMILQGLVEHS